MSHKSKKIDSIIEAFKGQGMDPHYLGYFDCFNRGLYFEAHEVLETIWLRARGQAEDRFYKGLIQLAGAFVHVQKHRPGPAAALFRLAGENLSHYPSVYQRLDLGKVRSLIDLWLEAVNAVGHGDLARKPASPTLKLEAENNSN